MTVKLDNNSIDFDGTQNSIIKPATNEIAIRTNGVERLRVAPFGNVGIGTSNPSSELDVNGTLSINGDINFGNGEILSDSTESNTQARIVAKASSNPNNEECIFAVESSGDATRFGVTQNNGGFFRDTLVIGASFDDGVLLAQSATLTVAGYIDVNGTSASEFSVMPQVGGNPVVESGSNSDGEWTRWADGTQTVFRSALILSHSSFVICVAAWSLPKDFTDSNFIINASYVGTTPTTQPDQFAGSATPNTEQIGAIGIGNITTSQVTFSSHRIEGQTSFSSGDEMFIDVSATGKWF